jgi:hypothetical protein
MECFGAFLKSVCAICGKRCVDEIDQPNTYRAFSICLLSSSMKSGLWICKLYTCFETRQNIGSLIAGQQKISPNVIDSILKTVGSTDIEKEDGETLLQWIHAIEPNSLSFNALCIFSYYLTSTSQPLSWEIYLACLVKFPREITRERFCVDVVNDHIFPLLEEMPQGSSSGRMLNHMSSIHVNVGTKTSWKALNVLFERLSPQVSVDYDALIRDVDDNNRSFFHHPTFWECSIYGSRRFQWLFKSVLVLSSPALNCAFSAVMQTTTWKDIGSSYMSYVLNLPFQHIDRFADTIPRLYITELNLPFQHVDGFADTLPRVYITVTSEHIAGILTVLSNDLHSFPVEAWKCLRKLLQHTSDDNLRQLRGEIITSNLLNQLEQVLYRACHACHVVPRPVPETFVDLLHEFETVVYVLFILRKNTSMPRLLLDARIGEFIRNYSRRQYIPLTLKCDDHVYAYEGNSLIMFGATHESTL